MRILVLCVLLYTLSSCVKDKKITAEQDYYAPINGELVSFLELYTYTSLAIKFQSTGKYNSYCKHIEGEMIRDGNTFIFKLQRVSLDDRPDQISPDTCGSTQISFIFPLLENGEYPITVKAPGYADNNGKFIVNNRRLDIKMDSASTIKFPQGTVIEY